MKSNISLEFIDKTIEGLRKKNIEVLDDAIFILQALKQTIEERT